MLRLQMHQCSGWSATLTPTPSSLAWLPTISWIGSALPALSFPRSLSFYWLPSVAAIAYFSLGKIVILAFWAVPVTRLHIGVFETF